LTSSQSAAAFRLTSTRSAIACLSQDAVDPQAERDILEYGFGKWIGPLEDHAHAPAQLDTSTSTPEDALAFEQDFALHARAFHQVVHAVEAAAEERNVDFPHPEGPIRAVTRRSGISSEISFRACFWP
jgi:hypothetical protein